MTRTTFYFTEQLIDKLRRESGRTGLSVSEILRRAADCYLADCNAGCMRPASQPTSTEG